jgi:oxygen-dependent protoporphyrinogen oxidase
VASFATRRLGPEVVDYAINPLIGGIYAGDPDKLAMRYAFPKLHGFEETHGSLVRGALAAGRARRKAGEPRFKSRSISFRAGLHEIIDALVREVGDSLYLATTVTSITPGTPWRLDIARSGEPAQQVEVDAVIVTVPAYAAAQLPFKTDVSNPLAELANVEYPPVTSMALGFRREQVRHPLDGYGVLVPKVENEFRILGTLFNSSLFPGRAPEGCVLLTTFVGGMRRPEIAGYERSRLQKSILEDLGKLLGVSGEPVFSQTTDWPRAIPQYNIGYSKIHQAIDDAEAALPGLFIGGHCRDGVSVGDCIRAGLKLADKASV